jgi:hypothetical protein
MALKRVRLFLWGYFLYSIVVVAETLSIVYIRDSSAEHIMWIEELFTIPGVILGLLACPDCAHGGNSLGPLIMSILIMLPYLAAPILVVVIIRWWKRISQPWTPKD